MASKRRKLPAQVLHDWLRMAEKTLAGAGRIAWQSEAELLTEIQTVRKSDRSASNARFQLAEFNDVDCSDAARSLD